MLIYPVRSAFTLLEVLVAIGIVGVLGAVLVPSVVGHTETQRILDTARDLKAIRAANDAYDLGGAKAQLGRISFATVPPAVGDTTTCNGLQPVGGTAVVTYTTAQAVTNWFGPYLNRANSKDGGFVTGIGIMNDRLTRTTRNGLTGDIVVTIPAVRFEDADALNDLMDGDANNPDLSNTLNSIRFGVPDGNLLVDMTYEFPMQAKDC